MRRPAGRISLSPLGVGLVALLALLWPSDGFAYRPDLAVHHAHSFWNRDTAITGYDPRYNDYHAENWEVVLGFLLPGVEARYGDCANFASQNLIVGGLDISAGPGVDNKGAIPIVQNLAAHLTSKQHAKPVALIDYRVTQTAPSWLAPGDIVTWGDTDRSFRHSGTVTGGSGNSAVVTYHSTDRKDVAWSFPAERDDNKWLINFYHIDSKNPSIRLRKKNTRAEITPGGFSDDSGVIVEATDDADGSGIASINIKHVQSDGVGVASHINSTRTFSGNNIAEVAEFPDPASGESFQFADGETYLVTVKDVTNNETSVKFGIDQSPPTFIMRDDDANGVVIQDEGTTGASNIFIQAEDVGPGVSGISAITLFGLDSEFDQVRSFSGLAAAETIFTGVPDGYYWVIVEDVAGNRNVQEISLVRPFPAVSLRAGRINVSAFRGDSSLPLSTLSHDVSISVSDSMGLSEVTVTGAANFSFRRTFPAGTGSFQSTSSDWESLPSDQYTIVAKNIKGNSTTIRFRIVDLKIEFLPEASESIYNSQLGANGGFIAHLKFKMTNTLPVREIRRINPSTGQLIGLIPASEGGFVIEDLETSAEQPRASLQTVAVDEDGNIAATTVELSDRLVGSVSTNFSDPGGNFGGTYLHSGGGGITAGYGSGTYTSQVIDLFQMGPLLPGAVMLVGSTGGGGYIGGQFASGPVMTYIGEPDFISGMQEIGTVTAHLRTGEASDSMGGQAFLARSLSE